MHKYECFLSFLLSNFYMFLLAIFNINWPLRAESHVAILTLLVMSAEAQFSCGFVRRNSFTAGFLRRTNHSVQRSPGDDSWMRFVWGCTVKIYYCTFTLRYLKVASHGVWFYGLRGTNSHSYTMGNSYVVTQTCP